MPISILLLLFMQSLFVFYPSNAIRKRCATMETACEYSYKLRWITARCAFIHERATQADI